MAKSRTHGNPFSYLGIDPQAPILLVLKSFAPSADDVGFDRGTMWIDLETQKIYMLTNIVGSVGTWTLIERTSLVITADSGSATPDTSEEIDILGGVLFDTAASGNLITASLENGTNGQVLIGGGSSPAWSLITSNDGTVELTVGANTLNIDVLNPVLGTIIYNTDSGAATVNRALISFLGGTNINTSASRD